MARGRMGPTISAFVVAVLALTVFVLVVSGIGLVVGILILVLEAVVLDVFSAQRLELLQPATGQ